SNYALNEFDDFGGEDDHGLDAVALTTVHSAKGLEWPVVFIPSITKSRFPSRNTGKAGHWLVPDSLFDRARYEGSETDERRLFYVALTRARDWVGISRHDRVKTKSSGLSPFFDHLQTQKLEIDPDAVTPSPIETRPVGADTLTISFSEVAAFMECGLSYRLRQRLGFPVRFAAELGYGKAVHHVLRTVAEEVKATGKVPKPADIDQILDNSFFLPAANKVGHREMKRAARELVNTYVKKHKQDLFRIWETERPFELRLDGVNVVGRADVILDQEGGVPTGLAIVDYKTSTKKDLTNHDLQLQVYTIAGQREGLDVRGAYVHDLKLSDRTAVSIAKNSLAGAVDTVQKAATDIKLRKFQPNPGIRCRGCEVRSVCSSAKH
ncbi:MAG: Dna2/Cas4 domain-containing protein, partial [Planctomycetes bacterium]|nr:Dna2/Cas4 domain-containing protein [Planctomycetota bacterium]